MFPYMIIETIYTHFQNGRPKWRHFFTSKVLIYENGYQNMDCTHSPVILNFSSGKKTHTELNFSGKLPNAIRYYL